MSSYVIKPPSLSCLLLGLKKVFTGEGYSQGAQVHELIPNFFLLFAMYIIPCVNPSAIYVPNICTPTRNPLRMYAGIAPIRDAIKLLQYSRSSRSLAVHISTLLCIVPLTAMEEPSPILPTLPPVKEPCPYKAAIDRLTDGVDRGRAIPNDHIYYIVQLEVINCDLRCSKFRNSGAWNPSVGRNL